MDARRLLIDIHAHMPPLAAVDGLSAADAERRVAGTSHSIAETVAHMCFWQEWFVHRCEGRAEPMPAHAVHGWPDVPAGAWPAVHARFAGGLEAAVALEGSADRAVSPAIEFPPLGRYTIGDALVHMAQHNSHHLGQVILLRQLMGLWPPPSGAWTW